MRNDAFKSPTAAHLALPMENFGNLVKALCWTGLHFVQSLLCLYLGIPFFSLCKNLGGKKLFYSPMLCLSISLWPLPQNIKLKKHSFGFCLIQNSKYSTLLHCFHIFRNLKRVTSQWFVRYPGLFLVCMSNGESKVKEGKNGKCLRYFRFMWSQTVWSPASFSLQNSCSPGCVYLDFKF